ncbi:MAG: hypothetical protein E7Z78_08200 [Methanobrevibacter thaueri]|jgi:phage host-nuclease inhibitor protein Gam|uniref:hypothetical protein n=1 Tax=Methanobrevibacter thaueri TaxID=190975 RepID=UPI0026EC8878|nr:hypothetical protein [Methanobrevibacter thaueri]MBE6496409.1 hypothetical protein [Methanobrevibacter thaueri]
MSKKDEIDLDKEIERLARRSNINMRRSENSFDNRLKRLDKEIDKVLNQKIKDFDDNKKVTEDYLHIDYKNDTINRYREKLKKM